MMISRFLTSMILFCFYITVNAQNVGIGTTTPVNKLTVDGKANITDSLGIGTVTPVARLDVIGKVKITDGTQGAGKVLTSDANGLATWTTPLIGIANGTAAGNTPYWDGTSWIANSSNIFNNGSNIGIGTTSPHAQAKLHIKNGSLTIDNNTLRFFYNGNPKWDIAGGNGSYEISRSGTAIDFYISGATGNVGIGTTTPGAKLEVAGGVKFVTGNQGEGKVLTSDANGNGSWISPTTISDALPTIQIGTQKWMRHNLDVAFYRNGDSIPQVTDPTTWANLTTGAWCYYNNDPTTGSTYGKLYNWYAVNDPRGLAPQGWHIPSLTEWNSLGPTLGGAAMAGGKLKQAGNTTWSAPNNGGNNNSGWEGLPGGYRDGGFLGLGIFGGWWTSQSISATQSRYGFLYNNISNIDQNFGNKTAGNSVRCIRD